MTEHTTYTPSHSRITVIHQRKAPSSGFTGFFNYLLLFVAATRFITGRIRQGLLLFALFLGLYLWDRSRTTAPSPVIRIDEQGIDFRGWGAMSWQQIESLYVEYAPDRPSFTYHFRIIFCDSSREMTEFTLSSLDISPNAFAAILQKKMPATTGLDFI
ncbi:MAG: hypothetical protein ACRC9Q_05560 [Bacteroidales bacterium]